MDNIFRIFLSLCLGGIAALIICLLLLKLATSIIYKHRKVDLDSITVGFFHPYCNAGGGGERVLWCAVRSIQKQYPSVHCVIYTGDVEVSAQTISKKAQSTFGISLPREVQFIFLQNRAWVEANQYPLLTLLGQSLGSIVLGVEALLRHPPDVYIDTMGYAFTLPVFKYLGGCATGCYVHYPTISTDMLAVVGNQNQSFNNRPVIARSKSLTSAKLAYYRAFAYVYGVCGACASSVMVNSSWTLGHVASLWKQETIHKIFPPCDIRGFLMLPLEGRNSDSSSPKLILSIGQFRPEKNHALQVQAFHDFHSHLKESERTNFHLVLAGGCRNKGDEIRVAELALLAEKLQITDHVSIKTNISYDELKDLLQRSTVGIHTMANEHFGIGVVEFQAAGVIALAHDSGGPKMDIIRDDQDGRTGFLADSILTYSEALRTIFDLSDDERTEIAVNARQSCKRFSEEDFEKQFLKAIAVIMR